MRRVGSQEQPVDAGVGEEGVDVVLPKRRDPHVLAEDVAGVLAEVSGVAVGGVVDPVEHVRDPGGAVLDAGHAQSWEALEEELTQRGEEEVGDGPALGDGPAQR